MMKGFIIQQQQEVVVEENMSNLTCASGEASVSSGNRAETGTICPQQYFASPNQPQPAAVKKKRNLPGNPDPDAEVIALSPKTLMATNRFLCEICNKGFQRDQNLQLHRRGHNLPWKLKQRSSKEIRKKVYVCPEASCVHHDPSRALGDLTGIKKHFCRKHGEKKWKCDKCSKRYAVQSDWKAHSKTCGTREYRCDCGTLFSRRDSFITHRAFCDALAEESARGAIPTNPLLTSQQPAGTSTSHMNLPPQFNMSHDFHAFSMKKEQQHFTSVRPEVPPWLAAGPPPPPPPIDLSSSIFTTTRLDQDLRVHENPINPPIVGPTLPPYHPTPPSPHMSATALLQKAAQMGASMSKTCSSRPHPAHVSANSDSSANNTTGFALNLSSRDQELATSSGFVHGLTPPFGNKAALPSALTDHHVSAAATAGAGAPPSSLLQDMMTSLSAGTGFEGTPFEDAFGGIWSTKNKDVNFHETLAKTTTTHHSKTDEGGTGGGGGNDGLTRDFLGLRALSHSDILNIAGLGTCINTSHEHHNHNQKSWQG